MYEYYSSEDCVHAFGAYMPIEKHGLQWDIGGTPQDVFAFQKEGKQLFHGKY